MGKQKITKKQKETIFIYRALSVRIFAFIMLLGGIVGIMFFFRPDTSEVEKRKLAEFPKPTLSSFLNGEYFYDLSLWYSDTYPMRDGLIAADQKIESLYGITPSTMMVGSRKISDDIPDIDEAQENSGSHRRWSRYLRRTAAPWSRRSRNRYSRICMSRTEPHIHCIIMTRRLLIFIPLL